MHSQHAQEEPGWIIQRVVRWRWAGLWPANGEGGPTMCSTAYAPERITGSELDQMPDAGPTQIATLRTAYRRIRTRVVIASAQPTP